MADKSNANIASNFHRLEVPLSQTEYQNLEERDLLKKKKSNEKLEAV